MKLQKTTWFLVVAALVLGGFAYFYEVRGKSQQEAIQAEQKQIFDFEEDEIEEIVIEKSEQRLAFERTNNENSPWQMTQPEDVPASDAAVSFLLNLLVGGKSDRTLALASAQKEDYGLEKPFARIEVGLKDQKRELILGNTSFDDTLIYAQVDPGNQDEEQTVLLVPIDFRYAVERELEEWKQED